MLQTLLISYHFSANTHFLFQNLIQGPASRFIAMSPSFQVFRDLDTFEEFGQFCRLPPLTYTCPM